MSDLWRGIMVGVGAACIAWVIVLPIVMARVQERAWHEGWWSRAEQYPAKEEA